MCNPGQTRTHHRRLSRVAVALSCLLFIRPAWAQDGIIEGGEELDLTEMSLEALLDLTVTTASKRKEKGSLAPSNVTVITAQQITEWGVRDLKEVLRRVAGYYVAYDRDEWVFAARGNLADNNQKYLVLVDGHRINSIENFGAGEFIELPNDLSNVERIEIVRGPGSAVWGADALAGVINIVTHTARSMNKTVGTTFVVGDDQTLRSSFQASHRVSDDVDVAVMGGYVQSAGRKITADSSTSLPRMDSTTGFVRPPLGRFTTELDGYAPSFMLQGKARVGDFSLNAYTFHTRVKNRQFEAHHEGRRVWLNKDHTFVEGLWSHTFSTGTEVSARISGDDMQQEYMPEKGKAFFVAWRDRRFSASVDGHQSLFGERLHVAGGMDYSFTRIGPNTRINNIDFANYSTQTQGFLADRYAEDNSTGAYVLSTLAPGGGISVHTGLRVDHNDKRGTDRTVVTPRVALVWQPVSHSTFKLLYNRGFLRPANFQTGGKLPVDAEIMTQLEAVAVSRAGPLQLTSTLFWQTLEGFLAIQSTGGPDSAFANTGDYSAQGVELELKGDIGRAMSVWANATYTQPRGGNFPAELPADSQRVTPDGELLNWPSLIVNVVNVFRVTDMFTVSSALRCVGSIRYRSTPADKTVDDAGYRTVPAFTYLDLNIGFHPTRFASVWLYGSNLLNERRPTSMSVWNGTVDQYGRYMEARLQLAW